MATRAQRNSKIVLITGATSGIGRATAVRLAEAGYRVFGAGRKPESLRALEQEGVEALPLDITRSASIAEARSEIVIRTGGHGVDILVNNAGFGVATPIELATDDDWRRQFETNVFGLAAVTRAFLPEMRKRGSGRIINISSINGRFTLPFLGLYNASKYAVESLSDALRMEIAGAGIRVVLVEPGPTRSEFADRAASHLATLDQTSSPYAAQLERVASIQAQFDKRSATADSVAAVIERAARARRPSARYVAPASAGVLLWLMTRLPTRWTDRLLRAFMQLDAEPTRPMLQASDD